MVIASGVIDRRHLSPFGPPSDSSSSFFSEDLVPTERQVGFWKSESMVDQKGSESFFASPLEKVCPMGTDFEGSLQHQGGQVFKGLDILNLSNLMGQGNTPSISWDDILTNPGSSGRSRIMASNVCESADTHNSIHEGDAPLGSTGEIEAQTIGDLLPSDDDFISGIIDGFEFTGLSTNQDDADEDIFCTGGGIELENDDSIKGDKFLEGSFKQQFSGECYINKYPSRTLIVRNINASIEDSELRVLFQRYGDIHMLHTSCKNHGFVTVSYYDIRAAQNAIRALHGKPLGMMNLDVQFSNPKENVSDKDIKVELGHPGEARSCLRLQCSRDWKQVGSPHQRRNSPPETVGKLGHKSHEGNTLHNLVSPVSPQFDMSPHGICTNGPQKLSSPIRIESSRQNNNQAAIGGLCGSLGQGNFGGGMQAFHPHSLPDCHSSIYNSSNSMPSNGRNASFIVDGPDYSHLHKAGSGGLHGHSFDQNNEAFGVTGVGSFPLHRHHYTWNNSNAFPQSPSSPMMWSNVQHPMHMHGYPGVPSHTLNAGANPMEQRPMSLAPNSGGSFGNAHSYHPGSLGNVGFLGSPQLYPSDLAIFAPSRGNYRETMFSPVGAGLPSMQQMSHAISGRNPMIQVSASYDATNDRMRSRRHGANAAQPENKRQFELDIDRIAKGEDTRTTLMLKNIPNKYNCKLILDVIDENHRGTYDFIYLPIDFKNKCNVGYAFINMTNPQHIIPFYKTFNGKKWEKFNSEKVASLAYARIQGRSALISHFQNSSLMNEDKWCRPILFHKDGPNAGDQEPFPVGNNVRSRPGRNKPLLMPEKIQASSISPNQENFSHRATEDSMEQHNEYFAH